MTMLEKMAKAMYEAEPGSSPVSGPQWEWDWMISEGWTLPDAFRRRARAALMAIREPDAAAIAFGAVEIMDRRHEPVSAITISGPTFTAMIDAILNESENAG